MIMDACRRVSRRPGSSDPSPTMNREPARVRRHALAWALLALAVVAGRAEAGCHVGLPNSLRAVAAPAHLEALAAVGALAGITPDEPGLPPTSPCPGGICSGREPLPIVPSAPAPAGSERWSSLVDGPAPAIQSAWDNVTDDGRAVPILLPTLLDRPPREVGTLGL